MPKAMPNWLEHSRRGYDDEVPSVKDGPKALQAMKDRGTPVTKQMPRSKRMKKAAIRGKA